MFNRLPIRRRVIVVALPVLLALVVAIGVVLAGRDENRPANVAPTTATTSPEGESGEAEGGEPAGGATGKSELAPGEPIGGTGSDADRVAARRAERAYRSYIAAINARDGESLCGLIAPGFERTLEPPAQRSGCASTIRASIGFSEGRGFPVWEETILSGIEGLQTSAGATEARVTADIVTRFADRTEPSVESDIAYLERDGGDWRLAKASGALYRAIGKPDFPPSVISPP